MAFVQARTVGRTVEKRLAYLPVQNERKRQHEFRRRTMRDIIDDYKDGETRPGGCGVRPRGARWDIDNEGGGGGGCTRYDAINLSWEIAARSAMSVALAARCGVVGRGVLLMRVVDVITFSASLSLAGEGFGSPCVCARWRGHAGGVSAMVSVCGEGWGGRSRRGGSF